MGDDAAAQRYLETRGSKLTGPIVPKKPARLSTSEKQREREELWAWIKRCFLACHPFCAACGKSSDEARLELDHVIPTGRGGKWEPENAQLLCAGVGSCHEAKTGIPWPKR